MNLLTEKKAYTGLQSIAGNLIGLNIKFAGGTLWKQQ
jgi:hypothetical protein